MSGLAAGIKKPGVLPGVGDTFLGDQPQRRISRCDKARTWRALLLSWWSRGDLNLLSKILSYKANIILYFRLEYQLEYRAKWHFT